MIVGFRPLTQPTRSSIALFIIYSLTQRLIFNGVSGGLEKRNPPLNLSIN